MEATVSKVRPDRIEWQPVGQFKLEGRRLYIDDSWHIGWGAVDVPMTPGVYDVDIKIHYYGSDDNVASLRGRLQGSSPDGEREAGEFGVDVASAGVIDADALDRWMAADEKAYDTWQQEFSESGQGDRAGFYPCPATGGPMLFTSTGFGDGGYNAVSLLEREKPVGFELRFLDDEGYEPVAPYVPSWTQRYVIGPIFFVLLAPFTILGALVRWSRKR